MATTADLMRSWKGPAVLSFGFRPFFLFAGVWAAVSMALWIAMLTGRVVVPTAFDPISWHAHEFLFGYLGAVVAGFLLTAVPNWTGRLPIVGWPLAGLAGIWVAGRLAVATSAYWSPLAVAVADLVFLVTLAAVLAREIIKGQNWRNLLVLAVLCVLILGNAIFHWDAVGGDPAAQGLGLRLGVAAGVMLIVVVGGRIVPSFTRNWLVKAGESARPAALGRYDQAAMAGMLLALILWVASPEAPVAGWMLLFAGALHIVRLGRWAGHRTGREPLVWVLHLGYACVPLGALALGTAILRPAWMEGAAAQHVWMAGAIGIMTLAVMTRATLGHTGQALTAGPATTALYMLALTAVLLRVLAGATGAEAMHLHMVSGLAWLLAFGGFALIYGRYLLRRRGGG